MVMKFSPVRIDENPRINAANTARETFVPVVVLYTAPLDKQPSSLIALGCTQVAAGILGGVAVEHHEI